MSEGAGFEGITITLMGRSGWVFVLGAFLCLDLRAIPAHKEILTLGPHPKVPIFTIYNLKPSFPGAVEGYYMVACKCKTRYGPKTRGQKQKNPLQR